jgi:hypothetical protein
VLRPGNIEKVCDPANGGCRWFAVSLHGQGNLSGTEPSTASGQGSNPKDDSGREATIALRLYPYPASVRTEIVDVSPSVMLDQGPTERSRAAHRDYCHSKFAQNQVDYIDATVAG